MRILASRKRDSVTGEEVVAVSHVVASTEGTRYSTSLSGSSEGAVILAVTETTLNIQGKLGNVVGSEHNNLVASSSSSSTKKGKHKIHRIKKVNSNCKTVKNGRTAAGSFTWRNRLGKGAEEFFATLLKDYCCSWNDPECAYNNSNKQETEIISKVTTRSSASEVKESKVEADGKVCESESCLQDGNRRNYTKPEFVAVTDVIASTASNATDTDVDVRRCNENLSKPLAPGITANIKTMRAGIYHEKQVKSLCALHALNNLLQDSKAFKQEDLDKICSELDPNSWVNPHKSVFGLGNYDINVIMTALQQKQLEAIWFDKRKDPSKELNFDNIYGFILNIPSECKLGWLALPIKRKHWVAIRNLPSITERDAGRNNYYNLDSKFDKPESIGSTENLIEYLKGELKSPEKELFLVVIEDIGRLETWRKNPPPPPSEAVTTSSMTSSSAGTSSGVSSTTPFLPVPGDNGNADGSAGNRRTSNDSGVVDLLPDLRDINVVDLNKEDLMRRQSSGVWSDLT